MCFEPVIGSLEKSRGQGNCSLALHQRRLLFLWYMSLHKLEALNHGELLKLGTLLTNGSRTINGSYANPTS